MKNLLFLILFLMLPLVVNAQDTTPLPSHLEDRLKVRATTMASPPKEIVLRNGQRLTGVEIKQVKPNGLVLTHSAGAGTININKLSDSDIKRFGLDLIEAETYENLEKAKTASSPPVPLASNTPTVEAPYRAVSQPQPTVLPARPTYDREKMRDLFAKKKDIMYKKDILKRERSELQTKKSEAEARKRSHNWTEKIQAKDKEIRALEDEQNAVEIEIYKLNP